MAAREGFVTVDGHRVWHRVVGDGAGLPLLTLHGGPGAGHDYLEPLARLSPDRPVVFYDQLGCGRSDRPDDPALWRIERFAREIDALRATLGLSRIHLLGQSWGGWLAIEYMLGRPRGIASLVLASTSASIPQFVAEAERLKAALPDGLYDILRRHEAAGAYGHPDYQAAVEAFYRLHLCRLDPWPDCLQRSARNLADNPVYLTLNGPNEFIVTGRLAHWERRHRLHEVAVPTLITVGRYDEVTPACAETLNRGIVGSRLALFEASSHSAHLEEEDAYLELLGRFLKDVETRGER